MRQRPLLAALLSGGLLLGSVAVLGLTHAAGATEVHPLVAAKPIPSGDVDNADAVFAYLVNRGFTRVEAAGVIGNLVAESNVNPAARQNAAPYGQGLVQWSLDGRWTQVQSVAGSDGVSAYTLRPQEEWIYTELKEDNFNNAFSHEAACGSDVVCAAYAIEHYYEIPNETAQTTADREGWAEGMLSQAPGTTSPALAIPSSGHLAVAFTANSTDKLWTWNGALNTGGNGTASNDGVQAGTNPSIAVLPNGQYAVAFHANDGYLWTWVGAPNTTGVGTATHDGMQAGTSPSLAVLPNGNLAVAFHAHDGHLWTWNGGLNSTGAGTATTDGMANGTNPSLGVLASGNLAVAFHASGTDKLWTWNGALNTGGNGTATNDGMADGTSPALQVQANGTLAVAIHASGSDTLWTWNGALNTTGTGTATSDGLS